MTPRPVPLSVIPEGIPDALKAERRWVVWNYEWREGDEKWTKIPYIATAPEQRASSVDPATWSTFTDALAAYEDGKCDGIGFVLGDGWTGFDGDDTTASEYVQLLDTYAERSVGGKGVHAICRGQKPGPKCKAKPYELYDQGRYFTVTGHHIPGTPTTVEERTAELAVLYARLFPNGNPSSPPPPSTSSLADDAVLDHALAAKNAVKFLALWHGNIDGYDSHSEADAALCALLAFWTNRDPAQMDRLFRRSGLMREKWDSRRGDSTYGVDAITNAIAGIAKGYTPEQELRIEFIKASEVQVMNVDWLWYARYALGAITLLEGAPDSGKSTLLVDTAARVSRGQSFPGETETREPGNVVMMIAEDDLRTTVVPRLMAAGADLEHIFFLGVTKDEQGNTVPFHLSDDSRRLRTKCQEVEAVFVVVDPLVSFLGSRRGRVLNTSNDLEVRKALGPLKELAEQLRASVAAIRHYRKGTGTDALEAGGGSVGFSALVRVILAALPNPHVDDDSHYLLAVAKNNLVRKQRRPAFEYEIVPGPGNPEIGCIAWGRAVDMSANEILAALAEAKKDTSGKAAEAKVFLEELLAGGDWVPTIEIMQMAKEQHGLSEFAVRRARVKLPIVAEKRGKPWYWRLAEPEF